MKKLVGILAVILVLLLIGQLALSRWLGAMVSQGISSVTGLEVKITRLSVNVFEGKVTVHQLEVLNPAGFPEPRMALIPEISVDLNWLGLLERRIHLTRLILNLEELNIVKNAEGVSNLSLLKSVQPESERPKEEKPSEPWAVLMDEFILTFRKVSFVDVRPEGPKRVEVDMRIVNQKFRNIDNFNMLVQIIVMKVLYNQTLGRLGLNIDTKWLQSELGKKLGAGIGVARAKLGEAGEWTSEAIADPAKAKKAVSDLFSKGKEGVLGSLKSITGERGSSQ
jgi:uncharacterized protein involved in outer membrane biogenesis